MTQPTDALAMSLDDIITKQKAAKKSTRGKAKTTGNRSTPYNAASKPKASSLAGAADKLVVSNLAQSVTQNDVKELFSRIGPIRSAQLNYNAEGKSKGVATVIFHKAGDAHRAFQEYHNRPLDEKPMRIELVINPESSKLKELDSRLGNGVAKHQGGNAKRGGYD
ncbi:hypothetical protein HDU91_007001 [Kappamyces sp. JEL0680]|nr:hypothetical protein HDU91_007001 [Kappamyces sp. JEL0680]